MKKLLGILVLILTFQSPSLAEELILKCSGVSIISEGVTKPLDSIYKKIINLDKIYNQQASYRMGILLNE